MKKILFTLIALLSLTQYLNAETITISVTESRAIYSDVEKRVPYTDPYDYDLVEYECGNPDKNSIGFDTLLGIAGGVIIGNQFSHHKDAAKVILGAGGGAIANDMRRGKKCYRKVPKTLYYYDTREEIIGYRNCGYFGNKKICKKAKNKQKYIYIRY